MTDHFEITGSEKSVLGSLPFPIFVVNKAHEIIYVNSSGEHFFGQGASRIQGKPLSSILPSDSPIFDLITHVIDGALSIVEYGVDINLAQGGGKSLMVNGSPLGTDGQEVVISIHQQSAVKSMERHFEYRQAARSVTAMAALLAHEVKNPLSGIRGAAQLLERTVTGADQALAKLIQDETDRVCALVDRIDVFGGNDFMNRGPVNIHEILQRVLNLSAVGFGQKNNFVTEFDPSLPEVFGNFDLLVQVFLNIIKNASEAINDENGEVLIKTSFRRGVSLVVPGGAGRVQLPLCVSITDNGPGIPESLAGNLFDPFVTTKPDGSGLGLAFVAKAIDDLGGIIEFDTGSKGTEFRVFLPVSLGLENV
ncbi:MAG: ATP-binding protein [Rhodospirillaceae bacterium]